MTPPCATASTGPSIPRATHVFHRRVQPLAGLTRRLAVRRAPIAVRVASLPTVGERLERLIRKVAPVVARAERHRRSRHRLQPASTMIRALRALRASGLANTATQPTAARSEIHPPGEFTAFLRQHRITRPADRPRVPDEQERRHPALMPPTPIFGNITRTPLTLERIGCRGAGHDRCGAGVDMSEVSERYEQLPTRSRPRSRRCPTTVGHQRRAPTGPHATSCSTSSTRRACSSASSARRWATSRRSTTTRPRHGTPRAAKMQRELDDPATRAGRVRRLPRADDVRGGGRPIPCVDQVVHGWDLAHADGLDDASPPRHRPRPASRRRSSATRCAARRRSAKQWSRRPAPTIRPGSSRSSAATRNSQPTSVSCGGLRPRATCRRPSSGSP